MEGGDTDVSAILVKGKSVRTLGTTAFTTETIVCHSSTQSTTSLRHTCLDHIQESSRVLTQPNICGFV